jgi:hypothetical protein
MLYESVSSGRQDVLTRNARDVSEGSRQEGHRFTMGDSYERPSMFKSSKRIC